jgi:hypothetical protein
MTERCPICGSEAEKGRSRDYGDRNQYSCPRCGQYEISRTAQAVLKHRIADRPLLAALLSHRVRKKQRQEKWPLITSYVLDDLTADDALPSAKEQLANLIWHLSHGAAHASDVFVTPTEELISVLGTVDADGAQYIVRHAIDLGFVRGGSQGFTISAKGRSGFDLGLTVQGWDEAEKLSSESMFKEQPVMPLNDSQRSERLKVFMCHSKGDKGRVRELYSELYKAGADPWFDEEVLVGGQDWELEIRKAVDGAHVFLAFLSTNMVNKEGYVQKELKLGLEIALRKPEGVIYIIPVRIDECDVPDSLRRYHWIDLPTLAGFTKLLKALQRRASELGLPTPITIPE